MKKYFLILIVFISLMIPTTVQAQGTYVCNSARNGCDINCDPDYVGRCKIVANSVCTEPIVPTPCKLSNTCEGGGLRTAIGCIPIEDTNQLFAFFLRWGLGIAGGIAFLLIVISSVQIITSTGDPKRLQAGKELLSAAIVGVMFLIFSVFILRIIGIQILNLDVFF